MSTPGPTYPDRPSKAFDLLDPRVKRWIWRNGWDALRDAQEEAISAVKTLKAGSASCIKAYTGLSEEAFRAAAAEAKRQGLPLLGHTPHAVNLRDASGFEVQHFNGIPYLHKPLPEDAEDGGGGAPDSGTPDDDDDLTTLRL